MEERTKILNLCLELPEELYWQVHPMPEKEGERVVIASL